MKKYCHNGIVGTKHNALHIGADVDRIRAGIHIRGMLLNCNWCILDIVLSLVTWSLFSLCSDLAYEFLYGQINDSTCPLGGRLCMCWWVKHLCVCNQCVPVCACINTQVCCVTKPSPVLGHLSNYCARLSCWPVGTLRRLNSELSLVYKTTAGQTETVAALSNIYTTLVFQKSNKIFLLWAMDDTQRHR